MEKNKENKVRPVWKGQEAGAGFSQHPLRPDLVDIDIYFAPAICQAFSNILFSCSSTVAHLKVDLCLYHGSFVSL